MSTLKYTNSFDVIVVGAGHAGIEAAYAAARLGAKTLLITLHLDKIGWMPCNPAIGGIGKGHIVFEISALGGLMPQLATQTYLQARMLNTRKGPAVHGLRLQIDKHAYSRLSKEMLSKTDNLTIIMGMVEEIITDGNHAIKGIRTREGATYYSRQLVITTGTFLNGLVHVGHTNYTAGRQGEEAALKLSDFIRDLGLLMGRLKTGTPPRLLRSSLDFSKMEIQESDDLSHLFEFYPHRVKHKMACYITHTNEKTHEVIKKKFESSPIFTGHIKGKPPRYCPSIEDKLARFPDKSSHHIFVEPESAETDEMYPNGLSTSMPLSVQLEFIQTIHGFENAIITRPGYAIEYDFVHPHQLSHTLEVKKCPGLFLAGQINGTTGYEEAAGQGIIAGINAAHKALNKEPFTISRTEGYLGIMIDDLVTLGVDEPYRMFTSRAESRLGLRQDTVFSRFADKSYKSGLINEQLYQDILHEKNNTSRITAQLQNSKQYGQLIQWLSEGKTEEVLTVIRAQNVPLSERAVATIHAELLYGPYLKREQREIEKLTEYQSLPIPAEFSYENIAGLSKELQQKLTRYKPATIAQASLIQGMTPAALSLLIFRVREYHNASLSCTSI